MKTRFLAVMLSLSALFAACEESGNEEKAAIKYCTYIAGGDCVCYRPRILSTDIICLPCDPGQTDCPNIVRLSIYCPPQGGRRDTCRITATRRSRECVDCPSNGKKIRAGDYAAVALGN